MSDWQWGTCEPGEASPSGVVRIYQLIHTKHGLGGWYIREYEDGSLWVTRRYPEREQMQKFSALDEAKAFAETMRALQPAGQHHY